jgi:hypothetical protein
MLRMHRMLRLLMIAAIGTLLFGTYVIPAAQPSADANQAIVLGMNVDTARAILEKLKIPKTQLQYSMAKDTDWLFRQLSREVDVVFSYSKSSHTITGIDLHYRCPPYFKGDYVIVPSRSIRFEKDGSYIVHCEAPKKLQGTRSPVAGELPPHRPSSSVPSHSRETPRTQFPPPTLTPP